MTKRFTTAYTIFSLVVFVFLILWFVFRAINTRDTNFLDAQNELAKMATTVSSSYLAGGSFASTYFREQLSARIERADKLEALAVSTNNSRIEYLFATNSRYIPQYRESPTELTVPLEYSYNTIAEKTFSTTVPVPSLGNVRLDAVFTVFGKSEVYPIMRELLVGLLSFLLITAILIIVYPAIAKKAAKTLEKISVVDPQPEEPIEPIQSIEPNESVTPFEQTSPPAHEAARDDDSGLYSPDTRLGWERYLEERLSAELKRAASFDQDLVFLVASFPGLRKSNPIYTALGALAVEFFNFQDLCFEYGRTGMAIIIPNLDIDQGIERAEVFKIRADKLISNDGLIRDLCIGMSARNGRLISGQRIIREARGAHKRSGKDGGGIVAFRVDPGKYREYIASRKSVIQR